MRPTNTWRSHDVGSKKKIDKDRYWEVMFLEYITWPILTWIYTYICNFVYIYIYIYVYIYIYSNTYIYIYDLYIYIYTIYIYIYYLYIYIIYHILRVSNSHNRSDAPYLEALFLRWFSEVRSRLHPDHREASAGHRPPSQRLPAAQGGVLRESTKTAS